MMMMKNKNSNSMAGMKVGTLIGKGAVFDGNFSAPETIRIDGTLNGNCDCKEQLIIGVDGQVKGDIKTQNVLISGRVDGDINATDKIELLATGKIVGNITAKALVVDEGGCFDGRCTMTTETSSSSSSIFGNNAYNNENEDSSSDNENSNKKKY